MLLSCLFLLFLSSVSFSGASEGYGYGYMEEYDNNMNSRGYMDENMGYNNMGMRANTQDAKTHELLAGSLDSVVTLMDTLLKGVKDAKSGNHKRAEAYSSQLDKHLQAANKYAMLLEEHNKSQN